MSILIDTGVWIGYFNIDDSQAERSNEIIEEVQRGKYGIAWTTTFIIDELFTFLVRATRNLQLAINATTVVLGKKEDVKPFLRIYCITYEECLEALNLAERYKDRQMNFTDLVSIVAYNKLGLSYIASYDNHFTGILTKVD
ncbi:MAG: type II toxin-antitoxin system VapC family toxin [Candidatus Heimdallarchaeota archaeon]